MKLNRNQQVFFELLRAGLWEKEARLSQYKDIDYSAIIRLAEEQSVVGLITAGLEWVTDEHVPQAYVLQFVCQTLQLEQRNKAMNSFVVELIDLLSKHGIYALLVKGQGIAQCYEKPMWRACGDVDLLLNENNYEQAKKLLIPIAKDVETEYSHFRHQGMTINGWVVELHGTLHSRLSGRVDRLIDKVQREVFLGGRVRPWVNGRTTIYLPAPDEDVVFVFTHILHHFFFEGIGLRQICDWCRLLWSYRSELDVRLLERRLREAGLMTEWKAFASFAVKCLGMPVEATPFYSSDEKWSRKAERIREFVLKVGNFGNNQRRDYSGIPYFKRKFLSFFGRLNDMLRHVKLFPKDSFLFFGGVLKSGLYAALRGE